MGCLVLVKNLLEGTWTNLDQIANDSLAKGISFRGSMRSISCDYVQAFHRSCNFASDRFFINNRAFMSLTDC